MALSAQDCLRLLRGRSGGRVAYTERALPMISPVGCALTGSHLVLHTHCGALAERLHGQVVALEVDDGSDDAGWSWTVVVTATARRLVQPPDLLRDRSPLPAGSASTHDVALDAGQAHLRGWRLLSSVP